MLQGGKKLWKLGQPHQFTLMGAMNERLSTSQCRNCKSMPSKEMTPMRVALSRNKLYMATSCETIFIKRIAFVVWQSTFPVPLCTQGANCSA